MLMVGNVNVIKVVKNTTMFHKAEELAIIIGICKPSDEFPLIILEKLIHINPSHFTG